MENSGKILTRSGLIRNLVSHTHDLIRSCTRSPTAVSLSCNCSILLSEVVWWVFYTVVVWVKIFSFFIFIFSWRIACTYSCSLIGVRLGNKAFLAAMRRKQTKYRRIIIHLESSLRDKSNEKTAKKLEKIVSKEHNSVFDEYIYWIKCASFSS